MAFNVDSWATYPDGLQQPGSDTYSTHLVNGFPLGAVIGKVCPSNRMFFVGSCAEISEIESGRLYLGINENPHWTNNVGSYKVKIIANDAYDVGIPR